MKVEAHKIIIFKVALSVCVIRLVYCAPIPMSSERTIASETGYNTSVANINALTDNIEGASNFLTKSVEVSGTSDVFQFDKENFTLKSDFNITVSEELGCPTLDGGKVLTQTQLIKILTAPCRYDRFERPTEDLMKTRPVNIYVRLFVNAIQYKQTSDLCFKVNGLLHLRYIDSRLAFQNHNFNRKQLLFGDAALRKLIWVPQLILADEHDSNIMEGSGNDLLTSISPDGTVALSTKIQALLHCQTDIKKFPFDKTMCSLNLESWIYNTSDLLLFWEQRSPIALDPKMLITEYVLEDYWSKENIIKADINTMHRGLFVGNCSSLSFSFVLAREVGFYVMGYFLPSMMIVAISWVSFWLQPDQTPARTTLGTSTILSFITLGSSQHINLLRTNYTKISEMWFLGCTFFIFGSLVEFAFVNTIWRRKKSLELHKASSKYIFKSTIIPNSKRRESVLKNKLLLRGPHIISRACKEQNEKSIECSGTLEMKNEENKNESQQKLFATMTPHQAALWIDRKARFLFPLAFVIFNSIFWTLIYSL